MKKMDYNWIFFEIYPYICSPRQGHNAYKLPLCMHHFFFAPETITTSCRNHVLHPSSRQIVEVLQVTWPCSPKLNKAQCPPLTEDPTTAWPKAACRLTQKIGISHTHTQPKRPHVTTVGNPSDFETAIFCTFRSLDLFPFKTCGSSEHLRCCPKTRCCGCYRLSQHVPSHNLSRVKKKLGSIPEHFRQIRHQPPALVLVMDEKGSFITK